MLSVGLEGGSASSLADMLLSSAPQRLSTSSKSIWVMEVSDYGDSTRDSQGALIYTKYRTATFGPEQSLY